MNKIIHGDCLEKLKELEDNSIDSIVTDPPYELGFMGKSWDNTGIANNKDMWAECLRVLKPGGHLLAFSGTRTYHRMASAIEDAGFEVRDMIEWVYGSGFPKSLNIGKAVDKLQGNEREVIGVSEGKGYSSIQEKNIEQDNRPYVDGLPYLKADRTLTKGTSEWEGWGTALKPAHEPICMARKPLAEKTVAENVLKYGTGGINIDESRVDTITEADKNNFHQNRKVVKEYKADDTLYELGMKTVSTAENPQGRFPANLIHDNSEEVRECFPSVGNKSIPIRKTANSGGTGNVYTTTNDNIGNVVGYGDTGNASRFFKSIIYQAKASKSERNKGCEELPIKSAGGLSGRADGSLGGEPVTAHNNHPTVKPIALMEYLIKMVTKPGGIVLDPFAGSGSTLVAAKQNGYDFVGIELTEEYIPIIKARLSLPD